MFGNFKSNIPGLKSAYVKQIGVVVLVTFVAWGALYLLLSGGPEKVIGKHSPDEVFSKDGTTTNLAAPGDQVDSRDRWIGNAGKKVAEHEARLQLQETQTKDILAKFTALEKLRTEERAAAAGKVFTPSAAATSSPSTPGSTTAASVESNAPATTNATNGSNGATGTTGTSGTSTAAIVSKAVPALLKQKNAAPQQYPVGAPGDSKVMRVAPPVDINRGGLGTPVGANARVYNSTYGDTGNNVSSMAFAAAPGIGVIKVNSSDKAGIGGAPGAPGRNGMPAKIRQEGTTFLPIGFVPVRLLGGVDAPTGGQAQNNPLPVIMEVTDMANLPNHFRANVKHCMVIGAAVGDMSSERGYIRAETLSCIRRDGRVLEVKAHGSIYGEDGKLGMRGRVVEKQGQLLANALLAGVVGGIGKGISSYTAQTATTITNGTSTVDIGPGQYAKAGVGAGMGQALDRLANYYITLAEKTFPVIEIDAQRRGELAFTKGIELDTPLPDLVEFSPRGHGRRPLSEGDDE